MSSSSNTIKNLIQTEILKLANPTYSEVVKKYFKNVLEHHGVKSPKLRVILKEVTQNPVYISLDFKQRKELGYSLLSSKFAEEKWVGFQILSHTQKEFPFKMDDIVELENMIDLHCYDWGTIDGLSGSLLHGIISTPEYLTKKKKKKKRKKIEEEQEEIEMEEKSEEVNEYEQMVDRICSWSMVDNYWRKRASCVSFIKVARFGYHAEKLFTVCQNSIHCQERFCQLGVGWLLRELSLYDRKRVTTFLKTNSHLVSREGLRYAIEKYPEKERKSMMKNIKKE